MKCIAREHTPIIAVLVTSKMVWIHRIANLSNIYYSWIQLNLLTRTGKSSFILAAPVKICQVEDIYWYELEVTEEFGSVTGSAFNSNGDKVSEVEFQLQNESTLKIVYYQNKVPSIFDSAFN